MALELGLVLPASVKKSHYQASWEQVPQMSSEQEVRIPRTFLDNSRPEIPSI